MYCKGLQMVICGSCPLLLGIERLPFPIRRLVNAPPRLAVPFLYRGTRSGGVYA